MQPGILISRMSWGRDLPSRALTSLLLHSFFVPCFSYLSFTVHLLCPLLLCPSCPHFFLRPLSVYLNLSYTNIQQMTWLWYNNHCHHACLSSIILHLRLFHLFRLHILWSRMLHPICAVWSNMGFNPHWFWPYYKHTVVSTLPIQHRRS